MVMSYKTRGSADILEADDKIISSLFIAIFFITVTAVTLGFVSNNTDIFQSDISSTIVQILLLFGFLFLISIAANYKGLDLIQDHAYTIIKWCYLLGFGITVLSLVLFGLLLSTSSPFGFILVGIGAVLAFIFWRIWPWLHERIIRAAQWLKIAATIVLNEPGMIFISFIQSLVIGIVSIVEFLSLYAWNSYAENTQVAGQNAELIGYIIMFVYLWFGLFVLYYFDGANTFIAYARIHGKDPKVGQGLNVAGKRSIALLGYALISAIMTVIVNFLYNLSHSARSGGGSGNRSVQQQILGMFLGLFAAIIDYIYYLISFFTLPSIVIRQHGTIEGMRESYHLFRRTLWDIIVSDTGYSYGAAIMYVFTGLILGSVGFVYGYVVGASALGIGSELFTGIIVAVAALVFGLFISRFFLKPLYTSLVTTMYVFATEGEASLKIVPNTLKNYLVQKSHSPEVNPENRRR